MSSDRCAVAFGLGAPLIDGIRASLRPEGYELDVVAVEGVEGGSTSDLESRIADAFPSTVSLLINGDLLFPLSGDQDSAVSLGLLRSFSAVKVVLRAMVKQRFGRIVWVTPSLNSRDLPHRAVRMGVGGLMKSVAHEVGSRGITANVIAPGYIADGTDDVSRYVALGRPATAEDIAGIVAFIATDCGGYLTGQVLRVDGGLDTA